MEQSILHVEDVIELLEICFATNYSYVDEKFFKQKDGMAKGSSLSPIVTSA
jgi:hypothetical protein